MIDHSLASKSPAFSTSSLTRASALQRSVTSHRSPRRAPPRPNMKSQRRGSSDMPKNLYGRAKTSAKRTITIWKTTAWAIRSLECLSRERRRLSSTISPSKSGSRSMQETLKSMWKTITGKRKSCRRQSSRATTRQACYQRTSLRLQRHKTWRRTLAKRKTW